MRLQANAATMASLLRLLLSAQPVGDTVAYASTIVALYTIHTHRFRASGEQLVPEPVTAVLSLSLSALSCPQRALFIISLLRIAAALALIVAVLITSFKLRQRGFLV